MDTTQSRRMDPPPYGAALIYRSTRNKSLKNVVLFCTICSMIWSVVVGASYLREMGEDGVSSKLKTTFLAQGIMFILLALLECVGFYAAFTQKVSAGRYYVLATIAGGILMTATEVTRMALHFVFKDDIKSACTIQNGGADPEYVKSWCDKDYQNGIWRDAAWLVFGIICSILMYILSKAFYHQLKDPNFGREQAPSDRYRMGAMNPPFAEQQGFVPPYSQDGAPNHKAGYGAPPSPYAMENQQPPIYDVPAYTPPEKGFDNSDRKKGGNDVYSVGDEAESRDLSSHISHNRSDSEQTTMPGRQGEGRI